MSQSGQDKIYAIVQKKVIDSLEKAIETVKKKGANAVTPWQKPWETIQPQNMITRKVYRGINVWLLSFLGYKSPFFLTFKQMTKKGGSIKDGEKGHIVVFWKWIEIKDKVTGDIKNIPFLRYYTVFNIEQIDGVEAPSINTIENFNPIKEAEKIVDNMPNRPKLTDGNKACYYPLNDTVAMPDRKYFHNEPKYYSTLFHELAHSTGHSTRLNRDFFGGKKYSKEELVAEMTATFLCATVGIKQTLDNSIAYLYGWLSTIKSDPKLIIQAGGQAQKACDYILDVKFEKKK